MTDHIPLFPLRQPLYPGMSLRLQIFEQRYLSLVSESLKTESPFAVVPIREGQEVGCAPTIYPVGTLVTIRDWAQLDNGLLGIVVAGDRRVRVADTVIRGDGLMLGRVKQIEPDQSQPLRDEYRDLRSLNNELAGYIGADRLVVPEDCHSDILVWHLASLLPLAVAQKVELLGLDDVDARLRCLRQWLLEMARE